MREVVAKHGILFIADEVVTGFGRIGHWFASLDEYGVQPDILVMAKGLTSGYLPLGATITRIGFTRRSPPPTRKRGSPTGSPTRGIRSAARPRSRTSDHRRGGSPRQCADGRRLFRESAAGARRAAAGGRRARPALHDVRRVRRRQGDGAPLPEAADISRRIAERCEARGLLVRPLGHLDIMSPPLILTREECDVLVGHAARRHHRGHGRAANARVT